MMATRRKLKQFGEWSRLIDVCKTGRLICWVFAGIIGLLALSIQSLHRTSDAGGIARILFIVASVLVALGVVAGFSYFHWKRMVSDLTDELANNFSQRVKMMPPDRNNWVAMKVVQQLVDRERRRLLSRRYKLRDAEVEAIKLKEFTAKEAETVIRVAQPGHFAVEDAAREIEDFDGLVEVFGFTADACQVQYSKIDMKSAAS